ncbi:MAG TPA: DUF4339 domain-containing protein [Opitutaceae bacterium]|nr:DUF4339 domain-containing protein [Opitutaceae bacterium]
MATQEYYIREASENEARGPFNIEQLVSLAETGQVTVETLWYDAALEDWTAIGATEELKGTLFPEKRKLRMKLKDAAATKKSDMLAPITIEDMLAGAEGRTAETRHRVDPGIRQAHAARIGMWAGVVCLVVAAAGELLPSADAIQALDTNKLIEQPLVFLGAVDLFTAIMLGLGVTAFYPFVRFRAAVGVGLFGFVYFTQGLDMPLIAAIGGSAGLYMATVCVNMFPVIVMSLLGIAGMAGTSYFLLSV